MQRAMIYTLSGRFEDICASSVSKAESGHSTAIGKRARALPRQGRRGKEQLELAARDSFRRCRETILSSLA